MGAFTLWICLSADAWSSHVEHYVIEIILLVICIICTAVSLASAMIARRLEDFGLLKHYINELFICGGHILLDEVVDGLTKADLVVETRGSNQRIGLTIPF
jgi:hypothetical protein